MRATWERGRWQREKWEIEPVRISLTTLFRPFLSCLDSAVKTVNTSVSYNHSQVSRASILHDMTSLCECVDIYVFVFVFLWEHPVFSALVSSFTCQSDDQKYLFTGYEFVNGVCESRTRSFKVLQVLYMLWKILHFHWANEILAACFTLRGHGTHIDLLWLLFLVGRICPLMREHFLWPLLNVKLFIAAE